MRNFNFFPIILRYSLAVLAIHHFVKPTSGLSFIDTLRYAVAPYSEFKKLGIPGPAPWPFVGNLPEYSKKVIPCQLY